MSAQGLQQQEYIASADDEKHRSGTNGEESDTNLDGLEFPTEESRDLSILQLGSANDFAETLVSFGCNTGASNCVRDNSKRHSHLFPRMYPMSLSAGRQH